MIFQKVLIKVISQRHFISSGGKQTFQLHTENIVTWKILLVYACGVLLRAQVSSL